MEKTNDINGKPKTRKTKAVYDVIIIGGCITGVATALTLQQNGLNVALLEYSEIGFLTSGCYSTHLNTYFDALHNVSPRRTPSLLIEGDSVVLPA